jgi:hypothetical protein
VICLLTLQSIPRHALIRMAMYCPATDGVQLATSLRHACTNNVELLLDDDPILWLHDSNCMSLIPTQHLRDRLVDVDQVLLAIPSLSRSRPCRIVDDP